MARQTLVKVARRGPRAAKPRLSRDLILEAAARLADEEGWPELSLARLAEVLKVRSPSLYFYVSGLPGLRRELSLLALRELGAQLSDHAIGKAGDAAVTALAEGYRQFVLRHPGLYHATVPAADPEDRELNDAAAKILDVCRRALGAYSLDSQDEVHLLRAVRSIAHGFATLEAGGGFGLPVDAQRSFRWLIATFLRGLHGK